MCPSNPKRTITAIQRTDAATIARLEVEEQVLFAISQRALTDWLDKRDELKDALMQAQNAEELTAAISAAERMTA